MAIQFEHYVTDSMLDLSQATQGLQNGELTSEDLKMLQLFLQRNLDIKILKLPRLTNANDYEILHTFNENRILDASLCDNMSLKMARVLATCFSYDSGPQFPDKLILPEALAQDEEVQKSQYYRQLNFLARYKRALNKAMEKDPASVQLCHHLNTLMTEVENGKNKGEDISILLGILEATNDYLTGAIRLQEYEKKRIDVLGPKPSKCLRAIGAVMMAIGALLVVVGIAIAASGVGLFPGALVAAGGGTALYSGYTLFAKGNGSLGAAVDDVANHPFSKKGV